MRSHLLNFATSDAPVDHRHRPEEQAIVGLLEEAGRSGTSDPSVKKLVAAIMGATSSAPVRNAAALALVDLGARDEIGAILDALSQPEATENSGTLVFALDELGGSVPLATLVQIVEHGSYEAAAEALLLVCEDRVALPDDVAQQQSLKAKLDTLRHGADKERAEAASIAYAALP